MKSIKVQSTSQPRSLRLPGALAALLCLGSLLCLTPLAAPAQTATEKVAAAADEAKQKVQEASQATTSKLDQIWRTIDENRLKNRTPDQIVAWIIMGLLVGGILSRITNFHWIAAVAFGLIGAFVGGIAAKVTGLDLGMGPVLIRYEDLLLAFLGASVLLLAARWFTSRKTARK